MTAVTFDTLAFVRQLKAAGFTETQSEAQADAINKVFSNFREEQARELSTKQDIKNLELKIESVKAEIIKWVVGMLVAQVAVGATLIKILS